MANNPDIQFHKFCNEYHQQDEWDICESNKITIGGIYFKKFIWKETGDTLREYSLKTFINKMEVSIVKWSKQHYDGWFEIYSFDKLFIDVERYKTMKEVLIRINEITKEQK